MGNDLSREFSDARLAATMPRDVASPLETLIFSTTLVNASSITQQNTSNVASDLFRIFALLWGINSKILLYARVIDAKAIYLQIEIVTIGNSRKRTDLLYYLLWIQNRRGAK